MLLVLLAACKADPEVSEAVFELHTSMGCELGRPRDTELLALGDFPTRRARFDPASPTSGFDTFPLGTREIAIDGQFANAERAGGRAPLAAAIGGVPNSLVVLPEGRSCPLSDIGFVARDGAAVASLPRGGLLIAGGTDSDGQAASSAAILTAGQLIAEPVPDGMLLRRRYASAVVAGTLVLVTGSDEGGGASETYEVFDSVRGVFARESIRQLTGPRMQHGAALLPDGSILLAGGRAEPDGAPLASAELIRLTPPTPEQPSDLIEARVAPTVLVLDSGAVLVAGGRDADDAVLPRLERFEAAAKRFVRIDLELPVYEFATAVSLPGARIAWIGCDTRTRRCGLTLVLFGDAEPVRIDVPLDWEAFVPLGLSALRAVALDDGRVLVTGREPDANMMRRALVVDIGARALEAYEATRAPTVLTALADGLIAELDAFGTSLRNLGSFSVYDSPKGDLLAQPSRRTVIDAPDRWEQSDEGLRALVSGARLDVPHLQFTNVRLDLRIDGDALIGFTPVDASEFAVGVGSRASAPGCPKFKASGRVIIERRGTAVSVKLAPDGSDVCRTTMPSASPARIAIRAEADAVLKRLELTRL
jgi:hypothetical protein